MGFVEERRARFEVEPICPALQVALSSMWRELGRRRDPQLPPARPELDAELVPEIEHVWPGKLRVYGGRKVWKPLHPESHAVALCTVARLLRANGWRGAMRGKRAPT